MNKEWLKNKISIGNGIYKYKCEFNNCNKQRVMYKLNDANYNSSIYSNYCQYHYKVMDMG